MIELLPATAFMVYLLMTLIPLLGIWAYHHYRVRKTKVVTEAQRLLVCEYCSFAYLDDIGKKVTRCPQCQSYNGSS